MDRWCGNLKVSIQTRPPPLTRENRCHRPVSVHLSTVFPLSPAVSYTIVFKHCADNSKSGEEENHLEDDRISYEPSSGNDRPPSPVVGEHQTTASLFTKSSRKTVEPRDGGSGKLSDSQCCYTSDADESSLESFRCSADAGYDFKLSSSLLSKSDNRSGEGSVTVNRDVDNYDGCSPR